MVAHAPLNSPHSWRRPLRPGWCACPPLAPSPPAGAPPLLRSYAPWCGACRAFKPELDRAAQLATANSLPFTIARLDAPQAMDIASEYDIKALPAYVLFRDGVAKPFPSLHTSEAMLAGASPGVGTGSATCMSWV